MSADTKSVIEPLQKSIKALKSKSVPFRQYQKDTKTKKENELIDVYKEEEDLHAFPFFFEDIPGVIDPRKGFLYHLHSHYDFHFLIEILRLEGFAKSPYFDNPTLNLKHKFYRISISPALKKRTISKPSIVDSFTICDRGVLDIQHDLRDYWNPGDMNEGNTLQQYLNLIAFTQFTRPCLEEVVQFLNDIASSSKDCSSKDCSSAEKLFFELIKEYDREFGILIFGVRVASEDPEGKFNSEQFLSLFSHQCLFVDCLSDPEEFMKDFKTVLDKPYAKPSKNTEENANNRQYKELDNESDLDMRILEILVRYEKVNAYHQRINNFLTHDDIGHALFDSVTLKKVIHDYLDDDYPRPEPISYKAMRMGTKSYQTALVAFQDHVERVNKHANSHP